MSKNPWAKFRWNDWDRDPQLRLCSFAAQGLWVRMLCIAATASRVGFIMVGDQPCTETDVAALVGHPPGEVIPLIAELESRMVFSRDRNGIMFCRRMIRDEKKAKTARKNGKMGGNPTLSKTRIIPSLDNPSGRIGISRMKISRARARTTTTTNTTIPLPPRGEGERESDDEFEKAWKLFPRKVGKGQARTAWARARKKIDGAALMDKIRAHARASDGRDERYIPHPATWLNGERWLDQELPLAETPCGDSGGAPSADDKFGNGIRAVTNAQWRNRMMLFATKRTWPSAWGGRPYDRHQTCYVPSALLNEFEPQLNSAMASV